MNSTNCKKHLIALTNLFTTSWTLLEMDGPLIIGHAKLGSSKERIQIRTESYNVCLRSFFAAVLEACYFSCLVFRFDNSKK